MSEQEALQRTRGFGEEEDESEEISVNVEGRVVNMVSSHQKNQLLVAD